MAIISAIQQQKRPIIAITYVPETVNLIWVKNLKVVAIDEKQKMPSESEYLNWLSSMFVFAKNQKGIVLEKMGYREFCLMLAHKKKGCILAFKLRRTIYRVFVD